MKKKDIFDIVNDTRKFEIGLFWKRSLFFWGFIATAFGGYIVAIDRGLMEMATLLASFGVICSFFWTLLNRGSKFWQENWEGHIQKLEYHPISDRTFKKLFYLFPPGFHGARKFSPSRLTIALSDYVVLVWLFAILYPLLSPKFYFGFSVTVIVLTIVYAVWVWYEAKSKVYRKFLEYKWQKDLTKKKK